MSGIGFVENAAQLYFWLCLKMLAQFFIILFRFFIGYWTKNEAGFLSWLLYKIFLEAPLSSFSIHSF